MSALLRAVVGNMPPLSNEEVPLPYRQPVMLAMSPLKGSPVEPLEAETPIVEEPK